MLIHIEPTDQIVRIKAEEGTGTVPARVWKGITHGGVRVDLLVTRLAANMAQDLDELDRELLSMPTPRYTNVYPTLDLNNPDRQPYPAERLADRTTDDRAAYLAMREHDGS